MGEQERDRSRRRGDRDRCAEDRTARGAAARVSLHRYSYRQEPRGLESEVIADRRLGGDRSRAEGRGLRRAGPSPALRVPYLLRPELERFAVLFLAVLRFADDRLAVERLAVLRLAVERLAVLRLAVERLAVLRLAVERFAVLRFAVDFFAVDRFAVERFAVDLLVPPLRVFELLLAMHVLLVAVVGRRRNTTPSTVEEANARIGRFHMRP